MPQRLQWILLPAAFVLLWSNNILGQQAVTTLEEIQVFGDRLDYSLADSPSPTLIYGKSHFQSFEPQTVGDMLNRVSGVAFSGDVGEYDAPQLRGLGSQYTQVLIDGERVPGNSNDRTVLVDRIPAELIERIELIRNPTANMDSQGIGGTLNLVLKDGADFQGTGWRIGGLYYPDLKPETRGTASLTQGISNDTWELLLTANVQERLNPKSKSERVFDSEGSLNRVTRANDFRDSTDQALQSSFRYHLGDAGTFGVRTAYLDSRIDENEFIDVLDQALRLESTGIEDRTIDQQRFEIGLRYDRSLSDRVNLRLGLSGSQFDDETAEQEVRLKESYKLVELQQFTRTDDLELQFNASLSWQLADSHEIDAGLGVSREDRDTRQRLLELDEGELTDATPGNGVFNVQETLSHAYVMDTWSVSSSVMLQYGFRIEETNLKLQGGDGKSRNTQLTINPSAHLLFSANDSNQFRASLARTLRRPSFNEIIPFSNRDMPDEDQITIGNPELKPEFAWGLDVGYTHQFDSNPGNFGLNLFYRKIEDRIELGRVSDEVFSPRNIGTGRTWGLELDFTLPLSFINRPDVGIFGNYVWVDSRIRDPFSHRTRRFSLQPRYMANVDLYHDVPMLGLSHGLSWQKQGGAKEFLTDEIKTVRYDSNLEYFVEKRFGAGFIVRLSVSNILDARKREHGVLYSGLGDLIEGTAEEYIFEREQAEPVFVITVRGSF